MSVDRAAQLLEAGIWLKLSGDREGARKLFERALKLDPTNQKAANLLAGGAEEPPGAPVPPPPAIRAAQGSHPFERPEQKADPGEAQWPSGVSNIPEPSLDSDWGRLTGAKTPVPQPMPPLPSPEPTSRPPGLNVVLGGTAAPESGPRPTLQLFGAPAAPPARHKTMQLFPPAQPTAGRSTLQLFGPAEEQPVPLPEPSTPPLFGYNPIDSPSPVTLGGMPTPSPSTPPLFASLPAAAPLPQAPMGNAWAWSSSPPPSAQELDPYPEARPSPSLAPRAESAWDQRSNPGIKLESVAGQDRALDLISSDSKVTRSPEARQEEIRAILRGARDLLDLDDHSGAMELIVKAQQIAPDDPEVLAMRERSEKTLLNMFESKLGKLEVIPRVLLKDDEIIWLNLDHRAGFVLAQIDGTVTFDDLFSVSGMSRIDTARILAQLVEEGVISRG